MAQFEGADALRAHMQGLSQNLTNEVADITTESMSEGKQITQQHISTRATDNVRKNEGRSGRIVSGKMLNAVSGDPATVSGGKVEGKFGWKPSDMQDYFWYQEDGFNHTSAGPVKEMHAVFDAFVEVREKWVDRLEKLK